jgi:putative ABC transport system substrate-binding protein
MRRRDFMTLFGGTALAWPVAARAQEAGRTYHLGCVSGSPRNAPFAVAMVDELRRLGFIEGQNLTIDWRSYGQRIDLIPEFAAELVKAHVDVIYAAGVTAIRAVQRATATIPILGVADDMVGLGLVNSLARPGGNTTGVSILAAELDGKRQELRRMATIADSDATGSSQLQALQDAAHARGVELLIHRIAGAEEITAAIDAAKASGAAALNVLSSPFLYSNRGIIMERVAALGLPAIYQFPEEAEEGGFVAYGPRLVQIFRELIARQIVKVLRGVKPADLPIEQPIKFELVINLKSAKALGLEVPSHLLQLADEVID